MGGGDVDEVEVGSEFGAETGAELEKGGSVGAREDGFGRAYFRSRGVEDTVGIEGVDGIGDGSSVEIGESLLVLHASSTSNLGLLLY